MNTNKIQFILEQLKADYENLSWDRAKIVAENNYLKKILNGKIANLTLDEKQKFIEILNNGYTDKIIKL